MPVKELTLILLLLARVRRVVTGRLRIAARKRLARSAPLGGHNDILPLLGPLLLTGIHPEIRTIGKGLTTRIDKMEQLF
jgi:hypothetical protein